MRLPRVYPIIDTSSLRSRGLDVLVFADALMDGGAEIVQFRHKDLFDRDAVNCLERVALRCRHRGVQLLVNDRPDLAALFHAGCHLGQDDLASAQARSLIGDSPLGFSTHDLEQLAAGETEAVDYLAFGPVFGTASKRNPDPVVGLAGLGRAREKTRKPLVAIGGITRETAPQVLGSGADSIAVIGDLLPEPLNPLAVRIRMEEWLHRTK